MGTYTRVGSYLLASELTSDPFGAIHRAVVIAGNSFDRHVLVRTFSEETVQAGMNTRMAESGRVVPLLGGARIFGLGYRIEGGKAPHVAWDYVPGRSLAQLIDKAKQEQIPFGVDHALTVIQGVSQGIVQMQGKGLNHGVLSPHSVWVSFEGATQIVDAPFASLAKSLLAKAPTTKHKLASYLQGPESNPLQQDLFALGALLYELLTFERLPVGGNLKSVLDQATLRAAQEDAPVPAEIRAFLGRLLLGHQPFTTMEAFSSELERVLYDGEYSPTTFNMAFFMHTLFREENDRDATAMKAEQGDNYIAYTAASETLRGTATRAEPSEDQPGAQEQAMLLKTAAWLVGGLLLAGVLLGLGYLFFGRRGEDPALQKQLAELQQMKAEVERQKAELDDKAKIESDKTNQLQKQLGEAKSSDEKARIRQQLEEAQQRKLDLERQQKAAEQRLAEQRQKELRLADPKKTPETAAAPLPGAPAQEAPKPQPAPESLKPATEPVPDASPAVVPVSEPAHMVTQAPLAFPNRALLARWEMDQDHNVRLKVFVGEQGQPLKVSITEGVDGPYGFNEAATDAANKSSFSPATRDGKPVRGWTPEIVYRFPKRR